MNKLLINESPMQVLPTLAVMLGLEDALFLQQLHTLAGAGWYRATLADLEREFPFWSASTIQRILARLKGQGLILGQKRGESAADTTASYCLDYTRLKQFLSEVAV